MQFVITFSCGETNTFLYAQVWQFLLKQPSRLFRPLRPVGANRTVSTTVLHRLPKGLEPNPLLVLGKGRRPKRIHPEKPMQTTLRTVSASS